MGRLEAFALANKPWASFMDGVGNGVGYGLILVIVAFFREIFGSGTLTLPGIGKIEILTSLAENTGYQHNGLMILPPMALITVGVYIWIQRSRNRKLIENH